MIRAVNVHVSCHLPLAHLCFDKKEGETFQRDIPSLSLMPFPKTQNKNPVSIYRVFSRDVRAAMLVYLIKGMAATLVSPTNPSGIELYS